jgi:hypothetical protein
MVLTSTGHMACGGLGTGNQAIVTRGKKWEDGEAQRRSNWLRFGGSSEDSRGKICHLNLNEKD